MKDLAFAGVITVAVALAAGAGETAAPRKFDAPAIVNFSRIDGGSGIAGDPVGFGGATGIAAMPWLKENGFASVINLRVGSEPGANVDGSRAAAQSAGLNYIHLPFDPADVRPEVVDAFLAAVSDTANQPVFMHCNSASRVAVLWVVTRVLRDGWTLEASGDEVRAITENSDQAMAFATAYLASHGP